MTVADQESVRQLIGLARGEDLGDGDLTSALLDEANATAEFRLVAKQGGILAGREIAAQVLSAYDPFITIEWSPGVEDGIRLGPPPMRLAVVRGPLTAVLAAERVLLNFLQRLSGVATATRAFVDAVAGTSAEIHDTRKTTPGWRLLEKYAVRCGGGHNHRRGLFDAVLIKDNHLTGVSTARLAAHVFDMLNRISITRRPTFVEVEAVGVDQARELLKVVGIDILLLDNFPVEAIMETVKLRDDLGLRERVGLEASGGVTLETVRSIALTGVERISVGAITHSAMAVDLSLERD